MIAAAGCTVDLTRRGERRAGRDGRREEERGEKSVTVENRRREEERGERTERGEDGRGWMRREEKRERRGGPSRGEV